MSVKFGFKPGAFKEGKVFVIEPSDSDFDFTRPAQAQRINEDGNIEIMEIDEPRIDYQDPGCPKLLLFASQDEKAFNSQNLDIDGNLFVWELQMQTPGNQGTNRYVKLIRSVSNNISIGYDAVPNQILFIHTSSSGTDVIIYKNCDTTLFRTFAIKKDVDIIEAKLDGVFIGYQNGVGSISTITQMTYSDSGQETDGKVGENTVDDDVNKFNSTATSYSALDSIINNYTIR